MSACRQHSPSSANEGLGTNRGSVPGRGNAVQTLCVIRTHCAGTYLLVDDGLFHWNLPD